MVLGDGGGGIRTLTGSQARVRCTSAVASYGAVTQHFLFSIGVAHAPLRDPSAQSLRLSIGEATIDGLVLLFVAMNGKC